ncbi:hypothetical protein NL676_030245 [Syzygium grande]|nr:hypothetical protein NL676_030245 [Syzygium grande]
MHISPLRAAATEPQGRAWTSVRFSRATFESNTLRSSASATLPPPFAFRSLGERSMAGDGISVVSHELKRREMDGDDGRDVISDLPESVLLHILSFLPTRDANPTIDSFRLNLNYAAEVYLDDPQYEDDAAIETRSSNKIGTWIRFAVRRKVKFLNLNFLGCTREFPDNLYMLPSFVLRCSCLVELKLASCEVRTGGWVQLRSLRKLIMKQIDLTDYKMANILSGCPLLKELSLEDCDGLQEPKFCCGPSIEELNLKECGGLEKLDLARSDIKHLTIDTSGYLELVCPNVKILDIVGCLLYVEGTDMSSLVDTSLYFSRHRRWLYREYHELRLLLEKLSCSPYFMPCDFCILLAVSRWKLAFEFNGFSYWSSVDGTFPCLEHQLKHVKIYGYVLEPNVIELIEFLLKNAQVLEKMEISTKKTAANM